MNKKHGLPSPPSSSRVSVLGKKVSSQVKALIAVFESMSTNPGSAGNPGPSSGENDTPNSQPNGFRRFGISVKKRARLFNERAKINRHQLKVDLVDFGHKVKEAYTSPPAATLGPHVADRNEVDGARAVWADDIWGIYHSMAGHSPTAPPTPPPFTRRQVPPVYQAPLARQEPSARQEPPARREPRAPTTVAWPHREFAVPSDFFNNVYSSYEHSLTSDGKGDQLRYIDQGPLILKGDAVPPEILLREVAARLEGTLGTPAFGLEPESQDNDRVSAAPGCASSEGESEGESDGESGGESEGDTPQKFFTARSSMANKNSTLGRGRSIMESWFGRAGAHAASRPPREYRKTPPPFGFFRKRTQFQIPSELGEYRDFEVESSEARTYRKTPPPPGFFRKRTRFQLPSGLGENGDFEPENPEARTYRKTPPPPQFFERKVRFQIPSDIYYEDESLEVSWDARSIQGFRKTPPPAGFFGRETPSTRTPSEFGERVNFETEGVMPRNSSGPDCGGWDWEASHQLWLRDTWASANIISPTPQHLVAAEACKQLASVWS